MSIDKTHMVRNFDRASKDYEENASLQNRVLNDLIENLQYLKINPKRILDLGSGPGKASRSLKSIFPKADIIQLDLSLEMLLKAKKKRKWYSPKAKLVCGDIVSLPFETACFDLIFSNLSLQWVNNIEPVFEQINNCLTDRGVFVFSSLGPDSMIEIKESWSNIDSYDHVNEFHDIQWYGDCLMKAGLRDPVLTKELLIEKYHSAEEMVRGLRSVGVSNVNKGRRKSLMPKKQWNAFLTNYEQYRMDNKLPLTYEVYFVVAWHPEQVTGVEAKIPVSSISRKS